MLNLYKMKLEWDSESSCYPICISLISGPDWYDVKWFFERTKEKAIKTLKYYDKQYNLEREDKAGNYFKQVRE